MSVRTVAIWKCRRCDKEIALEVGDQPPGWRRLHLSTPPLEIPAVAGDFCGECYRAIASFLDTPPTRAA